MTAGQPAAGRTPRPEPPPHLLIRTSYSDLIWHNAMPGEWVTVDHLKWISSWPDLDGGKYGDVELLVPLAYRPGTPGQAEVQDLAEAVVSPVGAMLQQLAAAAGAGITSVVGEAYRRGLAARTAWQDVAGPGPTAAGKIINDAIHEHLHGDASGADDVVTAAVANLAAAGLIGMSRG